jgi:hypothetical protein
MCVLDNGGKGTQEMWGEGSDGTPHGELSRCRALGQAKPHKTGNGPGQRRMPALCGAKSEFAPQVVHLHRHSPCRICEQEVKAAEENRG